MHACGGQRVHNNTLNKVTLNSYIMWAARIELDDTKKFRCFDQHFHGCYYQNCTNFR